VLLVKEAARDDNGVGILGAVLRFPSQTRSIESLSDVPRLSPIVLHLSFISTHLLRWRPPTTRPLASGSCVAEQVKVAGPSAEVK
jgi:hypothetical protein